MNYRIDRDEFVLGREMVKERIRKSVQPKNSNPVANGTELFGCAFDLSLSGFDCIAKLDSKSKLSF